MTHHLNLARQAQKMYALRDGQIEGFEGMACLEKMEARGVRKGLKKVQPDPRLL